MKWVVAVIVLLFAGLGARLEAKDLPRAASLLDRARPFSQTHYVRGAGQRLPAAMSLVSREKDRPVRLTHGVRGK